MPFCVAYIVSIMVRMVCIVLIISGIKAVSWGISASSFFISGSRSWMSSVSVLTPSSVSNTERSAKHAGML